MYYGWLMSSLHATHILNIMPLIRYRLVVYSVAVVVYR